MVNRQYFIWIILFLALVLRLPLLNASFWLDEAAQALESTRPFSEQLNLEGDFQPPLYHLLVFAFAQISHTEWWLRLASLLPALLTLYVSYRFARRLYGLPVALFASLLMATSQFHIFYSQELRPYALSALFAMLAFYLLSIGLKAQSSRLALIIVNALGLLTVYTYIFAIIGQLVFVLFSKNTSRKSYLLYLAISLLLCVWWLPGFTSQLGQSQVLSQNLPLWRQVVSPPALKTLPLTLDKFVIGRLPVPDQGFGLWLSALIVLTALILVLKTLSPASTRPLSLAFFASLFSAFLVTWFIPLLDPKRVLFLFPLFSILLAASIFSLSHRWRKGLAFLFLVVNCFALFSYCTHNDLQREPWREAVEWVNLQATPQTPVVFAFNGAFAPYDWYQTQSLPVLSTGYLSQASLNDLDPRLLPVLTTDQVIVFEYLMDLSDPERLVYTWLEKSGFRLAEVKTYPNLGQIRLYRRAQPFASIIKFL